MFGEISIWAWMGMAIVFGIGGGTGFFISRQLKDKRTLELEEKLASARNELAGYRGDVNQHFMKTSLLLGKLTNNYREVYEHLATGAQKLCNERPNTPELDLPDTKILPSNEIAESETPTIELASETLVIVPDTKEQAETEINQTVKASTGNSEQMENDSTDEVIVVETADEPLSATESSSTEQEAKQSSKESGRPAPEDIPDSEENDDDVHLGAESTPSVDTELHKTHTSIH